MPSELFMLAAGTPMLIEPVELPGYRSLPDQLSLGQYRIKCPGSLRNDSCRLMGSADALVAACNAHPLCQMVEYSPLGRDNVNGSMGTLKGTIGNRSTPIDLAKSNWNPRVELLVREEIPLVVDRARTGPETAGQTARQDGSISSGGLSGGAITGIAVGAAAISSTAAGCLIFDLAASAQAGGAREQAVDCAATAQGQEGKQRQHHQQHEIVEMSASRGPGETHTAVTVPASPTGSLTTPRRRGADRALAAGRWGQASPQPPPDAANATTHATAHGSASSPQEQQRLPARLGHVSLTLREVTAGPAGWAGHARSGLGFAAAVGSQWEEAIVREEDIAFLQRPDGRPISLGRHLFGGMYWCCWRGWWAV